METHSAAERFDAFVENLSRSGLVASEEVERRLAAFSAERPLDKNDPAALDAFAAGFVFDEVLTAWQCNNLRKGRWQGFFFHGYLILAHVGCDELFSYYLARHLVVGDTAVLRITPPSRAGSPGNEVFDVVWQLRPAMP